jgi:hypothetical protein
LLLIRTLYLSTTTVLTLHRAQVRTEDFTPSSSENRCSWCELLSEYYQFGYDPPETSYHVSLSLVPCYDDGPPRGYSFGPTGSNMIKVIVCRVSGSDYSVVVSAQIPLFTQDDNFAAQLVTARKPQMNADPSTTREQITHWLRECATHQCCPKQIDLPLPTRVIEVATLRVLTTEQEATGRYTALSYCWGSSAQVRLQLSTMESFAHQLDFNRLPQTIKDAILVTRSLSIPYLWVRRYTAGFTSYCVLSAALTTT